MSAPFQPGDRVRLIDATPYGKQKLPPAGRDLVVNRVSDDGRFLSVQGHPGMWNAARFKAAS